MDRGHHVRPVSTKLSHYCSKVARRRRARQHALKQQNSSSNLCPKLTPTQGANFHQKYAHVEPKNF